MIRSTPVFVSQNKAPRLSLSSIIVTGVLQCSGCLLLSTKTESFVKYSYGSPMQWLSVALSKDNLSVSTLRQVLYYQPEQEAFSVLDQIIAIKHWLPFIPMQWLSSISLKDHKETKKHSKKKKDNKHLNSGLTKPNRPKRWRKICTQEKRQL